MPTSSDPPASSPTPSAESPVPVAPQGPARPREIGGRDGPEPTRYGDWEKNGRCIDF
jgi:hypothetical protein